MFTQFLGAMAMSRHRLDELGISHLSLDGSTPTEERARRIEAFRTGEVDVFLMSLKTGGVGVNLTAADYVIHFDPRWNPATEEQAIGRAHRIGQCRPVTVYRLIRSYCHGGTSRAWPQRIATRRQLAKSFRDALGYPLTHGRAQKSLR